MKILLIGAGYMAIEYAKVLKSLKKDFVCIGRGEKSAAEFEKQIKQKVIIGGLDNYLISNTDIPSTAIVAISEEQLGSATISLLKQGVKNILVEKPGGLDFADIRKVGKVAKQKKAKVYLGYNRRFYASTEKALEIIKKDGGVVSFYFDFSEASFRIEPLVRAPGVKENWFLQNSTHVLDMAFFVTNSWPKKISGQTSRSLSWHPIGSIFAGNGVTQNGAVFSYHANWQAPGKWAIEIMTEKHKLIFRPLEKLQIQESGSFAVNDFLIDDELDNQFKPGIYKELVAFFGNKKNLCTLDEQIQHLKSYQQILIGNSR